MSSSSLNDIVAALQSAFAQPDLPSPALTDLKRNLSAYAAKNPRKSDNEAACRLQDELVGIYKERIEPEPKKLGLLMTVLKHLRPALAAEDDLVEWFTIALKPFVDQPASKRSSIEDAQDFVLGAMVYDDEASDAKERARVCARLADILLDAYMARTIPTTAEDQDVPLQLKSQAAQQLQTLLVAFGRKKAKDLFLAIDHYLLAPDTRFQALGLLAAFVEQQQAHLYLVVHTTLVEHLLKCLMNDTATVVVSAALRCLIMLLPHIPATVATQLPRLFLIYSRCICWEKFSASSTKEQRDLVTDERVRRASDSEGSDSGDEDFDPTWTTLHALPEMPESSAPELLHYFTYLYALYPLNFMSYIRKPRKYLKSVDFPGADGFDLDQAVIRSRTEQFQRVHLLHPSFFSTTVEDELTDNRWLKAEPSEVVAECHGLYAGHQTVLGSPGPPPVTRLPSIPAMSPLESRSGAPSPARTIHSGAPGSEHDSPTLPPIDEASAPQTPPRKDSSYTDGTLSDDPSRKNAKAGPSSATLSSDAAYLQRELMLLRNELNFERYLKQQHVAAIGQLKRNHVKAVTMEAETATLINANRALQKRLSDAIKFNEKMQKETQSRRMHTKQSEEQLTSKIRSLKADLAKQESIQHELIQAQKDCEQLRQLLVESEAREIATQEELEAKVQDAERLRHEIHDLHKQIRMHRDRELQFETAQAEQEMIKQDLESTKMMLKHRDKERERSNKAFRAKVSELEQRLETAEKSAPTSAVGDAMEAAPGLHAALADTRLKLSQMKRVYAQLLEDHTDLKIRYQELAGSVTDFESPQSRVMRPRDPSVTPDYRNQDGGLQAYSPPSARLAYPTDHSYEQADHYGLHRGYPPPTPSISSYTPSRPPRPDAYQQRLMTESPVSHMDGSAYSSNHMQSTATWAAMHSHLTPGYELGPAEMVRESSKSAFSVNSTDTRDSVEKRKKIKPQSEVRVYGRGGAQNIKLKDPKGPKALKPDKQGKNGISLKGIV